LHGDQIDTLDKKRDKVEQRIDKLAQDLLKEIKIPKVGGHVNLIFA
jgi:chaperonin cofactor prefoldin